MGVHWDSTSAIHGLQESLWFSYKKSIVYSILIEFGVPMKLVRLIKKCLNETYSKGKYLSRFLSKMVYNKEMLSCHCFSTLL
jgi:hypothetical protein